MSFTTSFITPPHGYSFLSLACGIGIHDLQKEDQEPLPVHQCLKIFFFFGLNMKNLDMCV